MIYVNKQKYDLIYISISIIIIYIINHNDKSFWHFKRLIKKDKYEC